MAKKRRIEDLHARVKRGAYRALPSRRSYIPREDGSKRPLAVAALEDKIVQRATAAVLSAIFEEDFLGFSYGFRPKREDADETGIIVQPRVACEMPADDPARRRVPARPRGSGGLDALRRFDLDSEAQVAVICGNGRAFSSGAGVHQRQLRKREEFLEHGTDCVAAASKRPAVKSRRLIRSVRRRGRAEQVGSSTRGPLRL